MAIKLYGAGMSACTSRVIACLHEKEADFELVPVNLFAGEHKQPPFLAKNVDIWPVFFMLPVNFLHYSFIFI